MGGGVRPPGAGPEIAPRRRPLLILPCSWEGPPTAPFPARFRAAYPPISDLQNLQKPAVNHLSRSSYADTPPYGRGVNNHLSRSSYGEDPPMRGGVTPIG